MSSTQIVGQKGEPISTSAGASSPGAVKRRLDTFLFNSEPNSGAESFADESQSISHAPLAEKDEFDLDGPAVDDESQPLDIFERSVDSCVVPVAPKCGRCSNTRTRSCSHALSMSMSFQGGLYFKQEDCIPAALDATASILNDKNANLDNVEMIYLNRRNSLVMGLNMALGRPVAPSRKNLTYSISSLSGAPPPLLLQQASPPKLQLSQLAVNFFSYAEMVNNDEYSRRPSLGFGGKQASQSFLPTLLSLQQQSGSGPVGGSPQGARLQRLNTVGLERTQLGSSHFLQLSKQIMKQQGKMKTNSGLTIKKKFLISPELSDNEESEGNLGRHMSITSGHSHGSNVSGFLEIKDDESFVSMSVGDCLRGAKSEIVG